MESKNVVTFCQNDLTSTSFAAFEVMRSKGELCDLTIKIQNCTVTAHRVILAAGIPYFRSLFTSSAVNGEEREFSVEDLDPSVFQSLIDFAYSGRVNISVENVHLLIRASHFLQLNQVLNACVEFLSDKLCIESVLEVRTLALDLTIPDLMENSDSFIQENFEEFSKSNSFMSLSDSCVKGIISEDNLNVSSEKTVFQAVINWVKASPIDRHAILPELLTEVRLVTLPIDYLIDKASSEDLMKSSTPCRNLIDEVKNYHLVKDRPISLNWKTQPRKFRDGIYVICSDSFSEDFIYLCDLGNATLNKLSSKRRPCTKLKDRISNAVAVNGMIYMFLRETIQTFHPKSLEWKVLEPRHLGISGACMLSHGDIIFCFGSYDMEFEGTVRRFDTRQDKWLNEGKMTAPISAAAAASLSDSIYVTGGYSGGAYLDTVRKYCPSYDMEFEGTWQCSEVASMLTSRRHHSCAAVNGKIYVCGGFNRDGDLGTAEMFDPRRNEWNFVAPMKEKRSFLSVVAYDGKIYALGGFTRDYTGLQEFEVYDSEGDDWKNGFKVPSHRGAVAIAIANK